MKNNDAISTPQSGSLIRRIFNPRHLPKYLFAVVSLATLGAVLLFISSRHELQARDKDPVAAPAMIERAAAAKIIPPAVPDDQNFAATPFFAAVFEKGWSADSSSWPKDYARAAEQPRRFPSMAASPTGQKTGRLVTDLAAWATAFEQSQSPPGTGREDIYVSDTPDARTNAVAATAVLKALKPYEAVLEELHAANRRPESRFNTRYDLDNPWATLLPHLVVVKRTVQLLSLKASADLAAGQAAGAMRDTMLMLRLVDAPAKEPTLISQLVRVAGFNLALQPIWEGLAERRWSEAQLQILQSRLQQLDFIGDLQRVMEAERAWGNLTIGLTRDKRPPNATVSLLGPNSKAEPWQLAADRAFASCPRDWFDQEQSNYNRIFDERVLSGFDVQARRFQPRVAEANTRFVDAALRDKEKLVEDHLVFAKTLLVAQARIHMKFASAQAAADLAVVACALERHRLATGQLPSTLAALSPRYFRQIPHDVIDGKPLRYELTDDGGFVLYSIGWNEGDDHGEPAFLASGRGTEIKDGDWVWRYPARK